MRGQGQTTGRRQSSKSLFVSGRRTLWTRSWGTCIAPLHFLDREVGFQVPKCLGHWNGIRYMSVAGSSPICQLCERFPRTGAVAGPWPGIRTGLGARGRVADSQVRRRNLAHPAGEPTSQSETWGTRLWACGAGQLLPTVSPSTCSTGDGHRRRGSRRSRRWRCLKRGRQCARDSSPPGCRSSLAWSGAASLRSA